METTDKKPAYQNNPFFVATDGLELLFKRALSVAILMIVLSLFGVFGQLPQTLSDLRMSGDASHRQEIDYKYTAQYMDIKRTVTNLDAGEWVTIGVVVTILLLIVIFIGTVLSGISDYTAARLARGKTTTLGEALRAVFARFFGYLWLQILIGIKVFLWTLLLVVPGIIMAIRYSLSGPAFFDKKLGAQTATKYSANITKGAWITIFASHTLFNIITLGLIQPLLQPGSSAVLYGQLDAYKEKDIEKPSAHALSWLTLLLPVVLGIFAFIGLALLIYTSNSGK